MPNTTPRFRWYELMTTDAKAAAAFYGAVVGWRAEAVPGQGYTLFHAGRAEGAMAGMLTLSPEAAAAQGPVWMGYVAVPDVDDYARRLVKAGGTVHQPPTDVPGVLRMAGVKDPTGTPFVIYKGVPPQGSPPDAGPPEGGPDEPGYVGWRELMAGDGKVAFDFYSGLFGWTKVQDYDMGAMGPYTLWSTTGATTMETAEGGMMTAPAGMAPMWNFYFRVNGIDAGAQRITAAGGRIANGPMQVPGGGWIVQATDPQGAAFNLLSATK